MSLAPTTVNPIWLSSRTIKRPDIVLPEDIEVPVISTMGAVSSKLGGGCNTLSMVCVLPLICTWPT